jgi:hypothetical protein
VIPGFDGTAKNTHLEDQNPQLGLILAIAEINYQWIYSLKAAVTWHSEYPRVVHLLFSMLNPEIPQSVYKLPSYRWFPSAVVVKVPRAAHAKNTPVNATERE